jgi:hypothetical protein
MCASWLIRCSCMFLCYKFRGASVGRATIVGIVRRAWGRNILSRNRSVASTADVFTDVSAQTQGINTSSKSILESGEFMSVQVANIKSNYVGPASFRPHSFRGGTKYSVKRNGPRNREVIRKRPVRPALVHRAS